VANTGVFMLTHRHRKENVEKAAKKAEKEKQAEERHQV
jgi:hypothetical protein